MNHSLVKRLNWNPFFVALPFAAMCFFLYSAPSDLFTLVGCVFVGVWFFLSLCDYFSSHKLLDWIYRDKKETLKGANAQDKNGM